MPAEIDVQCLAVTGADIFAGTVGQGVFLSEDNGLNWMAVSAGLPEGCSVWRIVVRGSDLFAVAGSKRASVFLSSDNGRTWKAANSGLPGNGVLCLMACGPYLFVGTGNPLNWSDAAVFQSADNGASWIEVNDGLPGQNPIYRFAAGETYIFGGTWAAGRVFRCQKSGGTWTPASSGLPHPMDFSLSDLAVHGASLFLASCKGVFLSIDEGTSWRGINRGLSEESSIFCLAVGKTDLFAGTEEGEIWRLSLSELDLEVQTDLAFGYVIAGRVDEAVAAFEKLTKLKPDGALAWFGLGGSYEMADRTEDAISAFHQAVKLKPEFVEAWSSSGTCYGNSGRPLDAIAAYESALKLRPDDAEAWYCLGNSYGMAGRTDDAAAAFERAKLLKPELFKKEK